MAGRCTAPFALGSFRWDWCWLRRVPWILTSSEPTTLNSSAAPVAVRAADLALIQLVYEALRTAGTSHERGDVLCLRFNMIELEHERVRKAAVNARGFPKALKHNADIASVWRHAWARELHLPIFSKCQLVMGQALSSRVALVTIRAYHLAFRHFQPDARRGDAKMDHVADVGRLCGRVEMIELQDNGIALPALDAGVLA
jgi:hypothetical protein